MARFSEGRAKKKGGGAALSILAFFLYFSYIPQVLAAGAGAGAAPPPCSPGIPCTSYTPGTDANRSKTDNDAQTCDGDVMNMIHARALLEAQRENMMNQIFIPKPDSVLEYSCFGEYAAYAASAAPPLFSESEKWRDKTIDVNAFESTCCKTVPESAYPTTRKLQVFMGKGHISAGLRGMVMDPFDTYITNNFSHSYLGGNITYDPGITSAPTPKGSVSCGRMQAVWTLAKCANYESREITDITGEPDPFMTFDEIVKQGDPRRLIEQCSNGKITETMIKVATNPAPKYETYDNNFTEKYPYAQMDGIRHPPRNLMTEGGQNLDPSSPLSRYSDPKLRKAAGTSGAIGQCAPPVETGVVTQVVQIIPDQESQTRKVHYYYDAICPNPNCAYNVDLSTSLLSTPGVAQRGFCDPVTAGP